MEELCVNLVYPEKSDIKYEVIKYPDGQRDIVIDFKWETYRFGGEGINPPTYHKGPPETFTNQIVTIKSKLNNFEDLNLILCTTAALRNLGVEEIHLYCPYILGSRSDRRFKKGGTHYIKDIIAPILNSQNYKSITCIDPHSDVLEACLNNFNRVSNVDLVKYAIKDMGHYYLSQPERLFNNFILLSPDAGASKKIYKVSEQIGYKGDIITCSKNRDENGKLTKIVVPLTQDDGSGYTMEYRDNCNQKDFIIIDDICDGGATFINIAKSIKDQISNYKGKIYLIVTHGIFSKGYSELSKYFDGVYCTNSYSDTLKGSYYNYDTTNLVKQLDVF